jgi:hypothetical protein
VECGASDSFRFSLPFCVFPAPFGRLRDRNKVTAYPIENMGENAMYWVPIKVALEGPIGYKNGTRFFKVFAFVRPGKRAAQRQRRR